MRQMGTGAGMESVRERVSREGGHSDGGMVTELACSALKRGIGATLAVAEVAARTAMSILYHHGEGFGVESGFHPLHHPAFLLQSPDDFRL